MRLVEPLRIRCAGRGGVLFLGLLLAWASAAGAGVNVWTTGGPNEGPVLSVAVHPTAAGTVYVGTGGGVFKSSDGGTTWAAASAGLTNRFVAALAVDPAAPDTVYAGTFGGGVFRSTNAGASWTAVNTGLSNRFAFALTVDPSDAATLYVGTLGGGVFALVRTVSAPTPGPCSRTATVPATWISCA